MNVLCRVILPMETENRWDEPFYDAVREWIISLLCLLVLNTLSYLIIQTYRQRSEPEESYAGVYIIVT
jgi:hypothetical protein